MHIIMPKQCTSYKKEKEKLEKNIKLKFKNVHKFFLFAGKNTQGIIVFFPLLIFFQIIMAQSTITLFCRAVNPLPDDRPDYLVRAGRPASEVEVYNALGRFCLDVDRKFLIPHECLDHCLVQFLRLSAKEDFCVGGYAHNGCCPHPEGPWCKMYKTCSKEWSREDGGDKKQGLFLLNEEISHYQRFLGLNYALNRVFHLPGALHSRESYLRACADCHSQLLSANYQFEMAGQGSTMLVPRFL